MKLKKTLAKTLALAALVAGSIFAGGAVAQAQDSTPTPTPSTNAPTTLRPHRTVSVDRMVDHLATTLALTDEQKTNVKAVYVDQQKQNVAIRSDGSLSQTDKRAKLKELREDFNTKIKAILTPDQYDKWQKTMMPSHHRPPPVAPAGNTTAPNSPPAQQ